MEHKRLVLIVEDSPTQAKKIAGSLRCDYFNVIVAADRFEGLRAVAECHPALVILDINLPGMDGYQICRRLRRDSQTAKIPIIMLTAAEGSEALLRGMESGADDYLPKDS